MLDIFLSLEGRLDRQPFLRAAAVIAGLCLLILVVIARGGLAPIAAAIGHPIEADNHHHEAYTLFIALVIVILLPAPILIKRLRDLRLPPALGFCAIALVETMVCALVPPSLHIAGPFAALAALSVALTLLSLAPGGEERADDMFAASEEGRGLRRDIGAKPNRRRGGRRHDDRH